MAHGGAQIAQSTHSTVCERGGGGVFLPRGQQRFKKGASGILLLPGLELPLLPLLVPLLYLVLLPLMQQPVWAAGDTQDRHGQMHKHITVQTRQAIGRAWFAACANLSLVIYSHAEREQPDSPTASGPPPMKRRVPVASQQWV